jgi:NADPH:quinone reductase
MRAVGVRAFGAGAVVEAFDLPEQEPGQGEVRVKVAFAGVNAIDLAMRAGAFAQSASFKTNLPLVLGLEGSGEVEKVGAGVTSFKPGDRVAWCLSGGTYAERAVVPEWRLVRVPEGIPLDVAAALQLQGSAAHYLTTNTFPVQKGDICLIHAGASGTGQLLIQICKLMGASVIATAGSKEKADIARARGADQVITYRDTDFLKKVLELTNNAGVTVVYDGVGKDTLAQSMRSLRRRGMCVNYGTASGVPAAIGPAELGESHSIFLSRPHLSDHMLTAEETRGRADDLFALHKAGQLTVNIDRVHTLADVSSAHAALQNRSAKGKILIKIA